MNNQLFSKMITNITCGYVYTTNVDNMYIFRKRFIYQGDQLQSFIDELSDQLSKLNISFHIHDTGIHNAPNIPFHGNTDLQLSSHYWIKIKVD